MDLYLSNAGQQSLETLRNHFDPCSAEHLVHIGRNLVVRERQEYRLNCYFGPIQKCPMQRLFHLRVQCWRCLMRFDWVGANED